MKKANNKLSEVLQKGGIALLPTDTVYGIFASAFNAEAINEIYMIKGRDFNKPLQVFFSSFDEVKKYALVKKADEKKIRKMLPGAFTVILKLRAKYNKSFSFLPGGTVGARVIEADFLNEAIKACGPLAATSANISGKPSPVKFRDIDRKILNSCGFSIKKDGFVRGRASTVVDATKRMDIIRK